MWFLVVVLLHSPTRTNSEGCTPFGGSNDGDRNLYDYRHVFANGSSVPARAVRDPATGVCFFPEANCASSYVMSGDTVSCCGPSDYVSSGHSTSQAIASNVQLLVFLLATFAVTKWLSGSGRTASPPSGIPEWLNKFAIYASIGFGVYVKIYMANTTQQSLTVSERNAMLAATAFLTPVEDIFQFIEDVAVVKVSFAVGSGNPHAVRKVLFTCVVGGIICGIGGAFLMTGVAFWPAAIHALATPGASNNPKVYPGCSLLPDTSDIVMGVKPLWLLSCWSWVFTFCGTGLSGLLMASREFFLFGLATLLSQGVVYCTWAFGSKPQNLTLLGLAGFGGSATCTICLSLAIFLNRPLRAKYGLVSSSGPTEQQPPQQADQFSGRGTLADGLLAMVYDLTLQLVASIGVYVGGFDNLAILYQLSAASAALPEYSSYGMGISFMCRLVGAALVGHGAFDRFKTFMLAMLAISATLGVIAVAAVAPFQTQISAQFAQQACQFASTQPCLKVLIELFGDGSEGNHLGNTFKIFTVTTFFTCVSAVARAGLYACQDFAFMAKASLAAFVIVFVPALLVARLVFSNAEMLYLATCAPGWVLTVIFLVRLISNLARMKRAEDGPWSRAVEPISSAAVLLETAHVEAGSNEHRDSTPRGSFSTEIIRTHSSSTSGR